MKCLGVLTSRDYGAEMIDITYLFQWSGPDETWNEKVKSQPGCWVTSKRPTFTIESDGSRTSTGTKYAVVWMPGTKTVKLPTESVSEIIDWPAEPRRTHRTANFQQYLAGLTEW